MHRDVFHVENASLEDDISRSSGSMDPTASNNSNRVHQRFQHQSSKPVSETERSSSTRKASQPDSLVGNSSPLISLNSLIEARGFSDKEFIYTAKKTNKCFCRNGTESNRSDFFPFQSNVSTSLNHCPQKSTAEEDITSSTSDNKANSIRFRSVSFCTGVSSTNKHSVLKAATSSRPSVPKCSILESILLDRNIPQFYSALGSKKSWWCDASRAETHYNDAYKRPRLHSLPLPTLIPSVRVRKTGVSHARYAPHWAPNATDDDYDEPVCLSLKKRKVSQESCDEISSAVAEERKIFNESNSFRNLHSVKIPTKNVRDATSSNGSILHSLLTKSFAGAEEHIGRAQHESMDFSQCSSSEHEPADADLIVSNSNPMRTINHVDSTDSLQTLERLALADKSRQVSTRQRRVVIAKKMQLVVNRKVRKWLAEISELVAKYRDLTNLPHDDWKILLRNALSRLLLLFMAESNFQFAVAPLSAEVLNPGEMVDQTTVAPNEIPTAQSVEDIQRFIAKCQVLKVDSKEYHCMRLITLFHTGCSHGLRRIALVEEINSGACKILQDLVRISRPDEKLRYGDLLLHLRSLASVNSRMVQQLFCISRDGRDGSYAPFDETDWLM